MVTSAVERRPTEVAIGMALGTTDRRVLGMALHHRVLDDETGEAL